MGLTVLQVEVGNPANPDITEKVEFPVNSGAGYSVVPSPILHRLGIKRFGEPQVRLADGTMILRQKGVAVFKYDDQIGGADVILAKRATVRCWVRSRSKHWGCTLILCAAS